LRAGASATSMGCCTTRSPGIPKTSRRYSTPARVLLMAASNSLAMMRRTARRKGEFKPAIEGETPSQISTTRHFVILLNSKVHADHRLSPLVRTTLGRIRHNCQRMVGRARVKPLG